MAKAKKTKKEEVVEPIGELKMAPSEKLEQCEWVFQFDNANSYFLIDERGNTNPTNPLGISIAKSVP